MQIIGFDSGRGYIKASTEINGEIKSIMFKSVYGDGRNKIELKNYDSPIYIEYSGEEYFIGLLAEKESYTPIRNSRDSKISTTVEILLAAALGELAVEDEVGIMFGVPYKNYNKVTLNDIENTYKGKSFIVKNKINNSSKTVTVTKVDIFREADASLFYAIDGIPNRNKPVGLVNIGFRTTELAYFDKGFKFNDKLSDTVEYGNSTMLKMVQEKLSVNKGLSKTLNEIDSSQDPYDIELKKVAYRFGSENINQMIEEKWINNSEMDLYLSGGTSVYMSLDDTFKIVNEPQMATAIGLLKVGKLML